MTAIIDSMTYAQKSRPNFPTTLKPFPLLLLFEYATFDISKRAFIHRRFNYASMCR